MNIRVFERLMLAFCADIALAILAPNAHHAASVIILYGALIGVWAGLAAWKRP